MDSRTVGKRLKDARLTGKTFTSKQVFAALHGDLHAEKLRLTREQADRVAIENLQSRKELVPLAAIVERMQRGLQAMVSGVMAMTDLRIEQRESIINRLRECGRGMADGDGDSSAATPLHGEPVG